LELTNGYELLEMGGRMDFKSWQCAGCGTVIEEIRTSRRDGSWEERPIRYPVRPFMMAEPALA
jgi:hypothetical protein